MIAELIAAAGAALAVVGPIARNVNDVVKLAKHSQDILKAFWGRFKQKAPDVPPLQAAEQGMVEIAAMPEQQFQQKVEEVLQLELRDEPEEVRTQVISMVQEMQKTVRTQFARAEDPTGATRPLNWCLNAEDEILTTLPVYATMFKPGDSPEGAPNWILEKQLGKGGMGEVWLARGKRMTNTCRAFKFCLNPSLLPFLELEMSNIELVQNELADHPHIVKLYEVNFETESPWLQYEYVDGGELGSLVTTWPETLEERCWKAIEALTTLGDTLDYCHNKLSFAGQPRALIHRDMKPQNVLYNRFNTLKITDMGISHTQSRFKLQSMNTMSQHSMTTTSTGYVRAGTAMYASEQQLRGDKPHPADDVHALGVMAYQLILGDTYRPLNKDWYHVLERKHICSELISLLAHSIASDVQDRYQHAGEMVEALRALPRQLITPPKVFSKTELDDQFRAEVNQRQAEAKN
ncbi:MAG: serine/threonine-protein kinase [Zavarzinella sp.]